MKKSGAPAPELYEVLTGFNYGRDNRRHEPGEVVELPARVADALLKHDPPAVRPHDPSQTEPAK
jgi:hypothetical protein